ncbi:Boron transporter 4 [Hordeum vulgare]|nr:Boron transporter 4 [Hordeum vulgare]
MIRLAALWLRLALDVVDTLSNRIFCDFLGKTMDSDASSGEEYGSTELDQITEKQFFDLSDSNEEVDMIILMSIQEEMDQQVEHIINFKGSIKREKSDQSGQGIRSIATREGPLCFEPNFP